MVSDAPCSAVAESIMRSVTATVSSVCRETGGGPSRRSLSSSLPQEPGDAPVHDVDRAELPDHDVLGLEVAVDHTASVSERDGLADLLEDRQEPGAILETVHRFGEQLRQGSSLDQPHAEERP